MSPDWPAFDLNPQLTEAMAGLSDQPTAIQFQVYSSPGAMSIVSFQSRESHPEFGQEIHASQVVMIMAQ